MLIDNAKIYTSGGNGGKGCQSLYKDIFHRKGVPDGGNGGDGGNIIVESDENLHTLLDFKYNQHYSAGNGGHGGSNRKSGKTGKDRLIKVPAGTIIIDKSTGFVIRDLASSGERVIVAKGGAGGKGNAGRKTATPGQMGEVRTLIFELKLVADAGIIGLPNAGKSTLISHISNARSKVAAYPFTTRSPILGMVRFGEKSFVVADMPGLIEGAHAGRGLGDEFLRHIERTKLLVHVVDMVPVDGSSPAENYFKLENELKLYSKSVYNKPRIIVANKMDLKLSQEALKKFVKDVKKKVQAVSALKGTGLKELVHVIYEGIENVKGEHSENNG